MPEIVSLVVAWALVAAMAAVIIFGVLSVVGGLGGAFLAGGILAAISYLVDFSVEFLAETGEKHE